MFFADGKAENIELQDSERYLGISCLHGYNIGSTGMNVQPAAGGGVKWSG